MIPHGLLDSPLPGTGSRAGWGGRSRLGITTSAFQGHDLGRYQLHRWLQHQVPARVIGWCEASPLALLHMHAQAWMHQSPFGWAPLRSACAEVLSPQGVWRVCQGALAAGRKYCCAAALNGAICTLCHDQPAVLCQLTMVPASTISMRDSGSSTPSAPLLPMHPHQITLPSRSHQHHLQASAPSSKLHAEREAVSWPAGLHLCSDAAGRLYVVGGMTSSRTQLASMESLDPRCA